MRRCKECGSSRIRTGLTWIHGDKVLVFICRCCGTQRPYVIIPPHIPDEQIERYAKYLENTHAEV